MSGSKRGRARRSVQGKEERAVSAMNFLVT